MDGWIPNVGAIFKHYKGGEYEVVLVSTDESTGKLLVSYRGMHQLKVWTRPLSEWREPVIDSYGNYTLRYVRAIDDDTTE